MASKGKGTFQRLSWRSVVTLFLRHFIAFPRSMSPSEHFFDLCKPQECSFCLRDCFYYVFPWLSAKFLGSKGWRSGESARLPPMWPWFKSWRRRHMWVEFVVDSFPCSERFFSGYFGFPLSSKTNTSKFHLVLERTDTFKRVHMNY